jgi:hypothetical protein
MPANIKLDVLSFYPNPAIKVILSFSFKPKVSIPLCLSKERSPAEAIPISPVKETVFGPKVSRLINFS